jgi:acetyl esterase/lipase
MRPIVSGLLCVVIVGLSAVLGAMMPISARPAVTPPAVRLAAAAEPDPMVEPDPTPHPSPTPTETLRPTATLVPSPTPAATSLPPTAVAPSPQPTAASYLPAAAPDAPPPAVLGPLPTPAARATSSGSTRRTGYRPPIPTAIPGVSIAADIPYVERKGCDQRQTSLDVYLPAGGRSLPVLIYVHGGGWSGGDKGPVGAKAAYFATRRFVFVSINYRLIPAAWPTDQAADVAEAIAWIRDNIAAYGGDGVRLFMLGHSAGAHLTALVASDETYLRRTGLDLTALRGVILLDSAAYDVEQLMRSPEGQLDVFRPVFQGDPAQWPRVSPRAHVAPGKNIPPHLLLLATASGQRRPAAEGLARALRDAGVYAHIADASAFRDHHSINEELGRPDDMATGAVQTFIERLLAGAPAELGGAERLSPGP